MLSESYFSNPWGYFWTRLSIISAKIETVQRWWGKTYTRDWRKKRVGGTDTTKTLLRDSMVQHCAAWIAHCQCYLVYCWYDIWYCIAISKTYCVKAYIQPPLEPNVNHCLVTLHVKYNTEDWTELERLYRFIFPILYAFVGEHWVQWCFSISVILELEP